jgi:predicted aconitase
MTMKLTDQEKEILDGREGEAARIALSSLVDLGELFGAEELISVSQAHIDATVYMVDAQIEFVERLVDLGAHVRVPSSLNAASIDLKNPQSLRVPETLLEKCRRLETAYLKMDATPTWTCAPYQQGMMPRFGERIAWGESNAIVFANSIIGARTIRYGDLMDICSAVTGKAPNFGLYLSENRRAEILIKLDILSNRVSSHPAVAPLLGYLIGELAEDRIAAVQGFTAQVGTDGLKALCAAAASSGAVSLIHIVGQTPEAQTLEMCLQGAKPKDVFTIDAKMIRDTAEKLSTAKGDRVDLVAVGCPHFSFAESQRLARLMKDRKVHGSVAFWVFTSRTVYGWIESCGLLEEFKRSGVTVFRDGCPLEYPQESWNFRTAMSNSVKFANYCYPQRGLDVVYGSLEDCVESAVNGRVCRKDDLWR